MIYGYGSHDITVDSCDLWGCGIIATDFINCHDIIVKNSVLRDCILCAVYASGSKNISYTDCVISGNWKNTTNVTDSPCVKLSGDNSVSFERCTFMNNNNYLLLPEDETLAAQVSMKDCTFLNNAWQDETPATCGVWDESVKQEGYTLYTCTVCGRTKQDDICGSCGMQGDNLQWYLHDGGRFPILPLAFPGDIL